MVGALFDTNILIDYLRGIEAAREELGRYSEKSISAITWMEIMAGAKAETETGTRSFLSGFRRLSVDNAVSERAVGIRKNVRVKLPDAIIWATAEVHSLLLVTRSIKDFPDGYPGVRCPNRL